MARRLGNIKLNEAAFFLCDMQERFRPAIKYFSDILEVSRRLVSCHCDIQSYTLHTSSAGSRDTQV